MKNSLAGRVWWHTATLIEPFVRLLLWRRLRRGKELRGRAGERRGRATLPRPPGRLLWLHAASVGETVSVVPLLEAFCTLDPGLHVLMTTGSVTSQRLLAQRMLERGLTHRVTHQFVPLDVPRWLHRFLDHWQPQAMALVESELWPNLIASVHARHIPMALVNARMSARSYRGWQKMPGIAGAMLRYFGMITARSEEDAQRLRTLGARGVESLGDLKAAAPPLPADAHELLRLQQVTAGRPILLAACTHEGEEAVMGRVHAILRRTYPDLLTIIAPRHPERGAAVATLLDAAPRRSLGADPDAAHGFWICDMLGEMGLVYRLSSIAFIGNSLDVSRPGSGGGHNPMEPARLGCAISIGPLNFNFNDAIRRLEDAGAIAVTPTAEAIAEWAGMLLGDPQQRNQQAAAGERIAAQASDLAPRLARRLYDLMQGSP